jgi:hypothetical protein
VLSVSQIKRIDYLCSAEKRAEEKALPCEADAHKRRKGVKIEDFT